jgi:hypothetical protein
VLKIAILIKEYGDGGSMDKVEKYLRVRIDMLCEERLKNDNEVAHMVIDSSVSELCTVLEMIEKQSNGGFKVSTRC